MVETEATGELMICLKGATSTQNHFMNPVCCFPARSLEDANLNFYVKSSLVYIHFMQTKQNIFVSQLCFKL